MKRRNADCGKLRRPLKRNKIADGMYGSTTILYMKFLLLWATVITADFMFMFRFEFLWPFWLLLRSVHDSFKYKGLAFSVLFVCIAITSDLVCLFFIPVHWLLFAASTYVWVQYVWHTDKGICLPTIILWMLFVYLEAGIRWKDSRHMPHLDLCRPFAAHCIGYPVVTLGFGFKSYVGYRMRQRKQREVAKENEFYMQLLQQALPQEEPSLTATATLTDGLTTTPATSSNQQLAGLHTTPNSLVAATTSSIQSAQSNSSLNSHHQQQQQHNHSHSNHNHTPTVATTSALSPASLSVMATASAMSPTSAAAAASTHNSSAMLNGSVSSGFLSPSHNHSHNHQQLHSSENHHASNGSSSGSSSGHSNGSNSSSNTNTNSAHHISNSLSAMLSPAAGTSAPPASSVSGVTPNGHIGKGHKNRSIDKDPKSRSSDFESSANKSHKGASAGGSDALSNANHQEVGGKEKAECDDHHSHQQLPRASAAAAAASAAQASKEQRHCNHNSDLPKKSATDSATQNGNVLQYDAEDIVTVEPVERTKGRRNRSKKDNSSKDNHHNNNNNNNNNTSTHNNNSNSNSNHHNSDASSVSSSTSTASGSTSAAASGSTSNTSTSAAATSSIVNAASTSISNIAAKVVSKICESCLKLEADVKKYRSEINHMKSIEKELRQKLDANQDAKTCLQAKQKACDDLEKRVAELSNLRHTDQKAFERRWIEERRQKQSLEAQLNNEKRARKLAEERAARPECSAQCRQRKQQMDEEIKQMRRDLKQAEEAKQLAEQHGRKCALELRMIEDEIRNRDSNQPGTEMLMSALAVMQDKNCTLEKNLSAETRVKLDLFSALGDAKRQLEISESRRRSKDEEILDLKAKIAQLLAVMPSDALCMPARNSTGAGSMLRMNDTPPLQSCQGPASPMLSSLNAAQASSSVSNHQMASRVVVPPTSAADYVHQQQAPTDYQQHHHSQHTQHTPHSQHPQHTQHSQHNQHHQHQQQQQQIVPVSVATSVLVVSGNGMNGNVVPGNSSLDPNATVYTPKTGAEA